MTALHRALADITSKMDSNKAPLNLASKTGMKLPLVGPNALPTIFNLREQKNNVIRNGGRLNNSIDVGLDLSILQGRDDAKNNSFDVGCNNRSDNPNVLLGLNYPKKNGFTRNLVLMNKDKTVFSGCKQNEKAPNYEEEERLLMSKLQEVRARKESIIKMIADNERKQKEKEALQEKLRKLMELSSKKIQGAWRKYIQRKIFRQNQDMQRLKALNEITFKVHCLIMELSHKFSMEKQSLINKIMFIQRNIRKFLAKKKTRALQRRQISEFLNSKLVQTIDRFCKRGSMNRIKKQYQHRMDDIAFFITSNVGCSIPSQSSDLDSPGRRKYSKRFVKGKSTRMSFEIGTNRFKRYFAPSKAPSSPSNTSRSSLKSGGSERRCDILNLKPCKASKKNLRGGIGDISETANPEDELSSERSMVKDRSRVLINADSPGRLSNISDFDPDVKLKTALRAKSRDALGSEYTKKK